MNFGFYEGLNWDDLRWEYPKQSLRLQLGRSPMSMEWGISESEQLSSFDTSNSRFIPTIIPALGIDSVVEELRVVLVLEK